MDNTMTEPVETPTPADVPQQIEQGEPDLGDAGKKALAAERERANTAEKSLKALQAEMATIEAAKLSDLERAQKEAADNASAAEAARAEVLRYRVASKHGITAEDAELFLTGTDEDTLTRQAQRLAERTTAGNVAPAVGSNDKPSDKSGDWLRDQFLNKS